jgi:hypothetical protein
MGYYVMLFILYAIETLNKYYHSTKSLQIMMNGVFQIE